MPSTSVKTSKDNLAEQFFAQVSESIQLVFDLTSRVDERVKMLIERHNELDQRVVKLLELHQSTINRLVVLESKDYPALKEDMGKIKSDINDIARISEELKEIADRLASLETKNELITARLGTQDNRWMLIFDAIWKMGLMLVAGYILYKLGLQAPPVP